MAFCQTLRKRCVRRIVSASMIAGLASYSIAQANMNPVEDVPSAIQIAKQIEENSLVELDKSHINDEPSTPGEALNLIIDVLTSGDDALFQKTLSDYENVIDVNNNPSDKKVLEIYQGFSQLNDLTVMGSNYQEKYDYLSKYAETYDWYVKFHTKRLLSYVHSHSSKYDLALQTAQEALELIPNELTDDAINARIIATELIAYLQNIKLNKDLALINTQRLIDLKLEAGQTIDGIELLNNLMYSLTAWRDNEARLELAKTLNRLEEKYGSTTPGLTKVHISRVYVDTGKYEEAIPIAQAAIDEAKLDTIQTFAKINLATAYAGIGNLEDAKIILSNLPEDAKASLTFPYAESVIALKEGRVDDALKLMNERYDNRVRMFLQERTDNTMEMLATLGDSSERQAEREEALKREQVLIQTRLEQQQDINRLLLALIVLIALTGAGALIFARHRHKLAKELAIKTQEAESADRLKTEFLGMVSHELRTPLNGIIGIADVLVDQAPTEQVKERGQIILSSGNVLFSMIESIIDMSRIDADKLELVTEETKLSDIIENLHQKYLSEINKNEVVFTSHLSQTCPEFLKLDPKYTEQIIDTLLSNAIKFTEKGRVHLHVTADVNQSDDIADIKVIVADTGQGISEEVQAKLFKPFLQADSSMTRKHGGSGLRLAIARSIARMMEGDLTVNSREGRGSEFTLTFKAPIVQGSNVSAEVEQEALETNESAPHDVMIAEEETDTEDKTVFEMIELVIDKTKNSPPETVSEVKPEKVETVSNTSPNISLEGQRVLIVEDTPSNQDVVEMILTAEGMKYVSVTNGQEALIALARHYFDYVIMDIRMPEMDGVETTRRIRKSGESWANIPIIALTADIAAENNAACMAAGTDIFLTKPILAKDLKDAIIFLYEQRKTSDNESRFAS